MLPAVIIAICLFFLRFLICYFQYIQGLKSSRQEELENALEALKAARSHLSSGSADFVAKAKNEREYIKLEKELNYITGKQKVYDVDGKAVPPKPPSTNFASYLLYYVQPALIVGLVYYYWSTPMALVAKGSLWPLGWFYLSKGGTSIGVLMWVFSCNSVASRCVPYLFDVMGCAPEPESQKGLVEKVMGFFKN